MSILKQLWSKYGVNPFDTLLRRAKQSGERSFLICWNRGLGDIPLGLYALVHRIRTFIPEAMVTFLTRSDLAEGFALLEGVDVMVDATWKRGVPFDLDAALHRAGKSRSTFDVILEHPDPTRWLMWQLGTLTPKLRWNPEWDPLCEHLQADKVSIGVHVQTETSYTYEKNWPIEYWEEFFQRTYAQQGISILLFGFSSSPPFEGQGIYDLRGKTSLPTMLSIIKNRCRYLLVPDSGVLSMTYYLNIPFPLHVVSLWADPNQGILKQKVPSPNPLLQHLPLIAEDKDLRTVTVQAAMNALFGGKN